METYLQSRSRYLMHRWREYCKDLLEENLILSLIGKKREEEYAKYLTQTELNDQK